MFDRILAPFADDIALLVSLADNGGAAGEHNKAIRGKFLAHCAKLSARLFLELGSHPAILKAVRKDAISKVSSQNAASKKTTWHIAGSVVEFASTAHSEDVAKWAAGDVESFAAIRKEFAESKPVTQEQADRAFSKFLEDFGQFAITAIENFKVPAEVAEATA